MKQMNSAMQNHVVTLRRQVKFKGLKADAILADVDALGQLSGFKINPDMVQLLFYQKKDFNMVKDLVKRINMMN